MKKILTIAALAFVVMSCGNKKEVFCVDTFYENPTEYIGQEVTITGHAKVCCCSGQLMITGCDKSKVISVIPAPGVEVPKELKNVMLKTKGIIGEEVIDEEFVLALTEKANAIEDAEEKASQLARAEKIKEIITVEGVIRNYTIDATSIEVTKACCSKEDAAKAGCEKKCDGKHEGKAGCEKKCEGKQEAKACCEKKCENKQIAQAAGCQKKCDGKHEGKACCEKKCDKSKDGKKACCEKKCDGKKDAKKACCEKKTDSEK